MPQRFYLVVTEPRSPEMVRAGAFESDVRLKVPDASAAKALLPKLMELWPKDTPYIAKVLTANQEMVAEDGTYPENVFEDIAASDPAYVLKSTTEESPRMYRKLIVPTDDRKAEEAP